jgi:hypothetical protein
MVQTSHGVAPFPASDRLALRGCEHDCRHTGLRLPVTHQTFQIYDNATPMPAD